MNEGKDLDDDVAELGFEPAVSVTGVDDDVHPRVVREHAQVAHVRPASVGNRGAWRAKNLHFGRDRGGASAAGGLKRRLGAGAVLIGALLSMGGVYAAFAGTSSATESMSDQQQVAMGKQLFEVSCITCHGANLQGVLNRGPSLIGVGGAATYFQVSTGRMPLAQQAAESIRKTPRFDDAQTRALSAYVQSVGGGTAIPSGSVRGDTASIADGGVLFRLNCAACHGTTFKGAPLSAGKVAPGLNQATDLQITTAMLSGPESMPVFSDNQLTPHEKKAIVAYIQTLKASADPGGSGIDRIGPVSEAIVLWVVGVGVLMIAILWIGAKQQ